MIPLLILFLLIIAVVGIQLIRAFTLEERPFILIPSGMVWGVSLYIFLLNLVSKFLPGQTGIIVSTLSLLMIGLASSFYLHPLKIKFPKATGFLILAFLTLLVIYFARLKMTAIFPVADNEMQWAYAASFARGNSPLMVPWQPDLSPNYHLGAYFFEGALLSLLNLPLITIHSILNIYYLVAGCLFVIFLLWDTKYSFKNLWLIIASLALYISYGVIVFVLPSGNFLNNIDFTNIFYSFSKYPADFFAKGGAGAALIDLNSLSYLPARSLSIGLAFLALYFSSIKFRSNKIKIFFLVLIFSVTALVEESMFLPMLGTLFFVFIFSFLPFQNLNYLKKQRKTLFITIISTFILVALQGGFLTDLLNQKSSSFNIKLPFLDPSFFWGLEILKSHTLTFNEKLFNWYFISPLAFIVFSLIYSFFAKNKVIGLMNLCSLSAYLCFLTIEYKYSPTTNIRFYSFGNIIGGTSLIYLLFFILKSKSLSKNFLVFLIIGFFILVPSLVPEFINQSEQINEARLKNIRSQVLINSNPNTAFEQISTWASKNLPINSRLLAIDSNSPTPERSLQFEYKGLYTLLGPQNIHTNRPEPGTEFFDLSLTLNPHLFRDTKTEYLYVESDSPIYKQLPQFRKDELSNPKYFKILQSIKTKNNKGEDVFYGLYKVQPAFLDNNSNTTSIQEGTLTLLNSLIPEKLSVYISDYDNEQKLPFWYRMALVLALKDKDIRKEPSQTDYQVIETIINYKPGKDSDKYDFYILGPNQKPIFPAKLIWSNIFASAWKMIY